MPRVDRFPSGMYFNVVIEDIANTISLPKLISQDLKYFQCDLYISLVGDSSNGPTYNSVLSVM